MSKARKSRNEDAGNCPEENPAMGDKTPEVFEWFCRNQTEQAKERYIGRVVCGRLVKEHDVEVVAKKGLPQKFKTPVTTKVAVIESGFDSTDDVSMEGFTEGAGSED